jgi:septal ring factor EnvC (AmiA/AmiB activator)
MAAPLPSVGFNAAMARADKGVVMARGFETADPHKSRLLWARGALTAQKAPDTIALAESVALYPDRQQFDAMLHDIHSMRQSIDRIAAGQEQLARSIDQIATTIAATQEQMTRTTDQTASMTRPRNLNDCGMCRSI